MGNQAMQNLRRGVLAGRGLSRPGDTSEIQARGTADRILASSPPAHTAPLPTSAQAAGPGEPLAAPLRAYFEPRLNASLDHVRIRRDQGAAREADALNARAFTAGNVISFAHGQYAPHSSAGLHLLAHELAHVTQDSASNTVPRETWDIDDNGRTIERNLLVNLNFYDTITDWWNSTGWTDTRKDTFRTEFERSIEGTFNNGSFVIKPPQSYADVLPQANIDQGYTPRVDIITLPGGSNWPAFISDWDVDVSSNSSGNWRESSNAGDHATMDEADNTAVPKRSSAPGVTQKDSVHEFGHFIGLDHPGYGLDASARNPSGGSEYAHTGTDEHGHAVNGPNDLMGGGMDLRAFYFDDWARALERHVAQLRRERMIEDFRRDVNDFFDMFRRPVGDFPTPPPNGSSMG
jgi:hypothetical protein